MTITMAGPRCDVCGNYILPVINKSINPFKITGILQELHCCDKCREIVETALTTKNWKVLPRGPLREVFEKQETN